MCFFGGAKAAPLPTTQTAKVPPIAGASVEEDYADTLTDKQKRLRAGQAAAASTSDSLIQ